MKLADEIHNSYKDSMKLLYVADRLGTPSLSLPTTHFFKSLLNYLFDVRTTSPEVLTTPKEEVSSFRKVSGSFGSSFSGLLDTFSKRTKNHTKVILVSTSLGMESVLVERLKKIFGSETFSLLDTFSKRTKNQTKVIFVSTSLGMKCVLVERLRKIFGYFMHRVNSI